MRPPPPLLSRCSVSQVDTTGEPQQHRLPPMSCPSPWKITLSTYPRRRIAASYKCERRWLKISLIIAMASMCRKRMARENLGSKKRETHVVIFTLPLCAPAPWQRPALTSGYTSHTLFYWRTLFCLFVKYKATPEQNRAVCVSAHSSPCPGAGSVACVVRLSRCLHTTRRSFKVKVTFFSIRQN